MDRDQYQKNEEAAGEEKVWETPEITDAPVVKSTKGDLGGQNWDESGYS